MSDQQPNDVDDFHDGYRTARELLEEGVVPEQWISGFMRCVMDERKLKAS